MDTDGHQDSEAVGWRRSDRVKQDLLHPTVRRAESGVGV